jgi:hypothetical protein
VSPSPSPKTTSRTEIAAATAVATTTPLTVAEARAHSSARFRGSASRDAAASETLAPGVMSASNRASVRRTVVDGDGVVVFFFFSSNVTSLSFARTSASPKRERPNSTGHRFAS